MTADDPMTAVAIGTGQYIEYLGTKQEILNGSSGRICKSYSLSNEEKGYTVMDIETTHGDEVLVGNFHYINEGEYICAEGEYVDHPAHGPQYRMTSYTVKEPEDKAAMERYLASGAKALNLDAIHDTVHEMARDEARHGKAFEGLLKRYFGDK